MSPRFGTHQIFVLFNPGGGTHTPDLSLARFPLNSDLELYFYSSLTGRVWWMIFWWGAA